MSIENIEKLMKIYKIGNAPLSLALGFVFEKLEEVTSVMLQ